MCMDPVTMMVAGTAISGAGQVFGGIQASRSSRANAAMLEQQAALRLAKGEADAADAQRRYDRAAGTTMATAAASGISIESFYDIFADDAAEASLERKRLKAGAAADAGNIRAQASATRSQGQNALVGSLFAAAGTVFNNAGRARSARVVGPANQPDY